MKIKSAFSNQLYFIEFFDNKKELLLKINNDDNSYYSLFRCINFYLLNRYRMISKICSKYLNKKFELNKCLDIVLENIIKESLENMNKRKTIEYNFDISINNKYNVLLWTNDKTIN